MRKTLVILLIIFYFFSCAEKKEIQSSVEINNSSSTEKSESVFSGITENRNWPYQVVDSLLKDSVSLSSDFIHSHVLPWDEEKEGGWDIKSFLEMDSLKKIKKYEEYLDSLSIGETKDAQAWIYDTLNFDNSKAIIWGITSSSYEACPYFTNKSVYLTIFSEDKTIHPVTINLLANTSSVDAPVYYSKQGACTIDSLGLITCRDSIADGEYNDEYDEFVSHTVSRKYLIEANGNVKEKEIKKSPEKTFRK